MADKTEGSMDVSIPSSLTEKDKADLKQQFTAAIKGVLDKHAATSGKQVNVSLFWKSAH